MRDTYKIEGEKAKFEIEIEKKVIETIWAMANYTKFSPSELVNTALKRYIVGHKDFLPPEHRKG